MRAVLSYSNEICTTLTVCAIWHASRFQELHGFDYLTFSSITIYVDDKVYLQEGSNVQKCMYVTY